MNLEALYFTLPVAAGGILALAYKTASPTEAGALIIVAIVIQIATSIQGGE